MMVPLLEQGWTCLVPTYRNDDGVPEGADGRYALGLSEWRDVEAAVMEAVARGATEILLGGWSMGGAIALQLLDRSPVSRLVSRVVPHEELDAAVGETLEWVRQTAPGARTALKRDLNRQLPTIDFGMFTASLASEEVREGFAAFVEKRPPRWARRRT